MENKTQKFEIQKYIFVEQEAAFDNAFSALQKKLSKYGVDIAVSKDPCTIHSEALEPVTGDHIALGAGLKLTFTYEKPVVQYNDYVYAATLKKEDGTEKENLVFAVDDKEDFSRYFTTPFRCDHCKTKRFRKSVHIFRNCTNELMVATTCSREYFGDDVAKLLKNVFNFCEYFSKFMGEFEEGGGFGGRPKGYDVERLAQIAYGYFKRNPFYIGREKADATGKVATSTDVLHYFDPPPREYREENFDENRKDIWEKSKDFDWDKIVKYWEDKESVDNFTNNIKISVKQIEPRKGLIIWAVYDYMRTVEDLHGKKALAKQIKNEYYGKVKDRFEFSGKVLSVFQGEGNFGPYWLIKFIGDEGYVFDWFASTPQNLEKGDKVRVRATVKDHREYNGKKSTQITRGKVLYAETAQKHVFIKDGAQMDGRGCYN